ncbi:MAG: hypothetical protein JWO80_4411 [Bryobacterales bacterium]|nr:hypothetical protein [Bryobacterales bacterium]
MSMQYINREHPEYAARKAVWRRYSDLYRGGEIFRTNASEYLVRRGKEPGAVYLERLGRVFYENYVGSIIDWYAATALKREPVLQFEGSNESGIEFFNQLIRDSDLQGTSLAEFFRQRLTQTLVYGRAFFAVEFPRATGAVTSRAEEDASGRSRAYLVDYAPEDVINWSYDASGNLEWIVIRTSNLKQASVTDAEWRREVRWVYYDRETFRLYSQEANEGGTNGTIDLVAEGRHGLAAQHRVPVFEMKVSEGLWLMNKASLLQLEHFNKSNALAWALTMGLFAMPVVYSDKEWNQLAGESYYLQLGQQDRFGWTEPEGHVFQIAAENLERLKDEIYRVCYAMNQAGGSQVSTVQSGVSKQRDFGVTQEILRYYGDTVKDAIRQVLEAVNTARQDGLLIDVSGMDEFDIGDFGTELDDAKRLLDLNIQSDTMKKQLFKRLALKYFCDIRQDVKNQIVAEIDESFQT